MIILFQNILLLKSFLVCNGCFGLFTTIINRSGTSFCCTFSAWFFYKNVFYLIVHLWTRFLCHAFFPSQDIKQNVLFSSYLDNWWHHELWDLSSIILQSNGWQVEKEDRREIQKTEYRERRKSSLDEMNEELFRWNKKHFS